LLLFFNFVFFIMKILSRTGTVLLALLLLAGSAGFTITRFYCGPYLRSVHILTQPIPCCTQSNEAGGFCHSEKEYVKADIKSELPASRRSFVPVPRVLAVIAFAIDTDTVKDLPAGDWEAIFHPPPLLYRQSPGFIQSFLF